MNAINHVIETLRPYFDPTRHTFDSQTHIEIGRLSRGSQVICGFFGVAACTMAVASLFFNPSKTTPGILGALGALLLASAGTEKSGYALFIPCAMLFASAGVMIESVRRGDVHVYIHIDITKIVLAMVEEVRQRRLQS